MTGYRKYLSFPERLSRSSASVNDRNSEVICIERFLAALSTSDLFLGGLAFSGTSISRFKLKNFLAAIEREQPIKLKVCLNLDAQLGAGDKQVQHGCWQLCTKFNMVIYRRFNCGGLSES